MSLNNPLDLIDHPPRFEIRLYRESLDGQDMQLETIMNVTSPEWAYGVPLDRVHKVFKEELDKALGEAVGIAALRMGERVAEEAR